MPLLFYWPDYFQNTLEGFDYHLNQNSLLMRAVCLGDSLWAFTRTPDKRYALVADLIVRAKSLNAADYQYGRYRVWGDSSKSRFFQVKGQSDLEPIIRDLSCRASAKILGQSFQGPAGVRKLNAADHQRLLEVTQQLIIDPRSTAVPSLENVSGGLPCERQLLLSSTFDPQNVEDARERTLLSIIRRQGQPEFREKLLNAYRGKCAITGCDVEAALEAAHIVPYRGEATNHISNGILLRADLHTLFDLGLLSIEPEMMRVRLHQDLIRSSYADLEGLPLRIPPEIEFRPSALAIEQRWQALRPRK